MTDTRCTRKKWISLPSFVLLLLLLTVLTAGCIQPSDEPIENESEQTDPLLANFPNDDLIFIHNITSLMNYVISQGEMLGVNLTKDEMAVRAVKVAAKYVDTPNPYERTIPPGYYALNWGEFHITIGRAYNLTDEEILRYVPLTFTSRSFGHHGDPVPKEHYASVLDPEHKAAKTEPAVLTT